MELKYKTRGGVAPLGRQSVILAFCSEDEPYAMALADKILLLADVVVKWCDPSDLPSGRPELNALLNGMQLVITAVSPAMLEKTELLKALVSSAEELGLALVPVAAEEFDVLEYGRVFGNMQFIAEPVSETERSFDEKLDLKLRESLLGREETESIRNAFRADIFISYRKKDRAEAQRLIKEIRSERGNMDLGIWYDEYLTPGEDFDIELEEVIKASDAVYVCSTPNIYEKNDSGLDNYVVREEYPLAVRLGKPVVFFELSPGDPQRLSQAFGGGPIECVPAERAGEDTLLRFPANRSAEASPEKTYLLGLAYLSGVRTETDPELGAGMVLEAAHRGYEPAIHKLADLFRSGRGVKKDITESYRWEYEVFRMHRNTAREKLERALSLLGGNACCGDGPDALAKIAEDAFSSEAEAYFEALGLYNRSLDDGLFSVSMQYARRIHDVCFEVIRAVQRLSEMRTAPQIFPGDPLYFAGWHARSAVAIDCRAAALARQLDSRYREDILELTGNAVGLMKSTLNAAERFAADNPFDFRLSIGLAAFKMMFASDYVVMLQHRADALLTLDDPPLDELGSVIKEALAVIGDGSKELRYYFTKQYGDLFALSGDPRMACEKYEEAFGLCCECFETVGGTGRLLEMGLICDKIVQCCIDERAYDSDKAARYAEIGLEKRSTVAKYMPEDEPAWTEGLALSWEWIGTVDIHLRKVGMGLEAWRKSLGYRRRLAELSPSEKNASDLKIIEQKVKMLETALQEQ